MTIETIEIESRDQWLKERTKDVTSTEVSALYGLSPYISEFELFHNKRDKVVVNIDPNERMKWGTRLESAIAYGAAEDQGWDIEKFNVYLRDPGARIGSSFDFKINSKSDGLGILEIKNVDWLAYKNSWIDDGAGNIEAPEHIELQIQHQMEVADINWCALVALVGGNEQKVILRNRDRSIGQDLRQRTKAFWDRVSANVAPSPDYTMDAEFIIKKLHNTSQEGLIAEADAELEDMIRQYQFVHKEHSDLEKIKEQKRAEILERIGLASKVITSFGSLSTGQVKGRTGTLITADMVGTTVGATEGYRSFRFYPKKGK